MATNLRFIWLIGAIREVYPDLPETPDDGSLVLWDRQHGRAVVTVAPDYAQAICLEITESAPFTFMEKWLNELSNDALESEGISPTDKTKYD